MGISSYREQIRSLPSPLLMQYLLLTISRYYSNQVWRVGPRTAMGCSRHCLALLAWLCASVRLRALMAFRRFGMGRVKLHLVRYMGTYTILMFVSFLLWQAAGCPARSLSVGVSIWTPLLRRARRAILWRLLPISLFSSLLWHIRCIVRSRVFASTFLVVRAGCAGRRGRFPATSLRPLLVSRLSESSC